MKNLKIKVVCVAVMAMISGLTTQISAQDEKATELLTSLSSKMAKFESVSADFSASIVDKQAGLDVNQKGSVRVAGEKYKLVLDGNVVISDGHNLWTYQEKSNEVMIDLAEDMYEEEGIKPADLFTIWETGFKSQHAGNETLKGVDCEVVKLFPSNPEDKSFHTIKIFIDPAALEMKRAIIFGKEGNNITYDLESFNTDFIKSDTFAFDKSKYPGVEVIDNR